MTKEQAIIAIAKKHLLLRPESVCKRYTPEPKQDLSTTNSGADFYEVSVEGIKAALEEAFKVGMEIGISAAQFSRESI